ncbi:MAG: YqeG family HAD IIIA-type phosphatase [Tenericutes bacterium]|nr:YqeG family HAD IIIA-type phosphatase [Mycoplasmatota bacterium]
MIELFFKKKYFYPNDYKKCVYDIDFDELWNNSIRVIMLDLDNTLIPYDESNPTDKVHELFNKLKTMGFEVYIISNNQKDRVKAFAKKVDASYVYSARKPYKLGFKRALKYAKNPNPETVCLIGDQFMTDVLGGRRMNFYVIVVDTIKRSGEKWFTKISKAIERRVLKRLKRTDSEFYYRLKLNEKR